MWFSAAVTEGSMVSEGVHGEGERMVMSCNSCTYKAELVLFIVLVASLRRLPHDLRAGRHLPRARKTTI